MKINQLFKIVTSSILLAFINPVLASENHTGKDDSDTPMVITKVIDQAKTNKNWKLARATGKQAQVVFMSVSPATNPKNEIGMETHEFDQVILIVEGKAKVELKEKTYTVTANDMIFVPLGTPHNIINLNGDKPLKLISVYSQTDIPAGSELKTK